MSVYAGRLTKADRHPAKGTVASTVTLVLLLAAVVGLPGGRAAGRTAGAAQAAAVCSAQTVQVSRVSAPVIYLDTPRSTPAIDSAYEGYEITNTSGSSYPDLWVQSGSFAGPKINLATRESGRSHPGPLAAGASTWAFFYLTADGATASAEAHTISVYTTRPDLAGSPLCTFGVTTSADTDLEASANKVTGASSGPTPPQLGGEMTVTLTGSTGTIGGGRMVALTPASYASWPADAYRLVRSKVVLTGGNTGTRTNTLYLTGLNTQDTDYTAQFTFAVTGSTVAATPVSPMSHISSGTQTKHTAVDSTYLMLPPLQPPANNTTLTIGTDPAVVASSGGSTTLTATVTNGGTVPVALDDVVVTPSTPLGYTPGSAKWNGVGIAEPAASGSDRIFLGPFNVPANTTRTLTLTVAAPGVAGIHKITSTGHVAATQVDTSTATSTDSPATATLSVLGPAPTVTSVSPASGTVAGGYAVTVTGSNFIGVSGVTFGSTAAPSFTVLDESSLTATVPAGSGDVDVTVTTPSGTSATSSADGFAYVVPENPAPAPGPLTSSGVGTEVQRASVPVPVGGSFVLVDDGSAASTVPLAGKGTYRVDADNGRIVFEPVLGFHGAAPAVTYRVFDAEGQSGDSTYIPTVDKPAGPVPPALTSSGSGVQQQSVTVPPQGSVTLLSQGVPTVSVTESGQGTYVLDPATGTITFTPVNGFAGAATGVVYRVTDAYGQTGAAAYVPTVTASPTTPTPPTAPVLPSVKVPPVVNVDTSGRSVNVGCALTSGQISRCDVTLLTKTVGKAVVLGTGHTTLPAGKTSPTTTVRVMLSNSGWTLARRSGGVQASAVATIRRVGSATPLKISTSVRLFRPAKAVKLRPVYFATDSAKVRPADVRYLKRVRSRLTGMSKVQCDGYTDSRNQASYNRDLAAARARAVCRILTRGTHLQGIAVSWGETHPRGSNSTRKGRARNRRVEIRILG